MCIKIANLSTFALKFIETIIHAVQWRHHD
jgi:hypothetical protein